MNISKGTFTTKPFLKELANHISDFSGQKKPSKYTAVNVTYMAIWKSQVSMKNTSFKIESPFCQLFMLVYQRFSDNLTMASTIIFSCFLTRGPKPSGAWWDGTFGSHGAAKLQWNFLWCCSWSLFTWGKWSKFWCKMFVPNDLWSKPKPDTCKEIGSKLFPFFAEEKMFHKQFVSQMLLGYLSGVS